MSEAPLADRLAAEPQRPHPVDPDRPDPDQLVRIAVLYRLTLGFTATMGLSVAAPIAAENRWLPDSPPLFGVANVSGLISWISVVVCAAQILVIRGIASWKAVIAGVLMVTLAMPLVVLATLGAARRDLSACGIGGGVLGPSRRRVRDELAARADATDVR